MWGKIDIEQLTHRTAGTGGVKFGNKLVVQVNRLYDELVALTGKNVPEPRNHDTLKEHSPPVAFVFVGHHLADKQRTGILVRKEEVRHGRVAKNPIDGFHC